MTGRQADSPTRSRVTWLGAGVRRLALALALAVAAAPVAATQEYILPTLFDVTGVSADDVLNIRSAPSARAAILGTLAADARDIEVVAYDDSGRWARVNTAEQSGWVALRYLAYQVGIWDGPSALPATLRCFGTEPFWSLHPEGDTLHYATPDAPDAVLALERVLATGVFRDPRRAVFASAADQQIAAVIVPMACSDGMSDRAYGLDVTVTLRTGTADTLLTGCCSIAPR